MLGHGAVTCLPKPFPRRLPHPPLVELNGGATVQMPQASPRQREQAGRRRRDETVAKFLKILTSFVIRRFSYFRPKPSPHVN